MRDPFRETTSDTAQKVSELGIANSSARILPAGTVVLSRTASVGFATIMESAMTVSQHFVTWTCGAEVLPEYLLYVLRAMRREWAALQVGTTNVTVFMPDLFAVKIPLPELAQQQEIVADIRRQAQLTRELIDFLSAQTALLAEHREALVTAAVTREPKVPGEAA
jgi:type I restriction enzyme S subunit